MPQVATAEEAEPVTEVPTLAPAEDFPPLLRRASREPVQTGEIAEPKLPEPTEVELGKGSAEETVEDFDKVEREGEVTTYAIPGGGEHVAVVAAGPERLPELSESRRGWSAQFQASSVEFPAVLSESSEVRTELESGMWFSMTPEGIEATEATIGKSPTGETELRFSGVRDGVDKRYYLVQSGYEEETLLRTPASAGDGTLAWIIRTDGLSFVADSGQVLISGPEGLVGVIPTAIITDANGEGSDGVYTLEPLENGASRLTLTLDPIFLQEAEYPILVDPGAQTLHPTRDGWVNEDAPTNVYENNNQLQLKLNANKEKWTFVRFADDLHDADRLVYAADLKLENVSRDTGAQANMHRVSGSWPSSNNLKWSTRPSVAGTVYDSVAGGSGATWTFDAGDLYQDYVDGGYTDYGFAFKSGSGESVFHSVEAGGTSRPKLVVSYNDLPSDPVFKSPDAGTVEQGAIVLRINSVPSDANSDPVRVRYQISTSSGSFDANVIEGGDSGWVDSAAWRVPDGLLDQGVTYYWRVQAADDCGTSAFAPCSLVDAADATHTQPQTAIRALTMSTPNLGVDPRFEPFTRPLGNDMSLAVNPSNGNLNLQVPFDSRDTKSGGVRFGMVYNSLDTEDLGNGPGWGVYVGPENEDFPYRLDQLTPSNHNGVRLRMASGQFLYFTPTEDGASFEPVSPAMGSMTYTKSPAGGGQLLHTYVYTSDEGGIYRFTTTSTPSPTGSANLVEAMAPGTDPAVGAAGRLAYTYNGSGRLTQVAYGGATLTSLAWTSSGTGSLDTLTTADSKVFDVAVSSGSISVENPVSDEVQIDRSSGLVTEIRDGEHVAQSHSGWTIAYGSGRVSEVTSPVASEPWAFSYEGPFSADNAAATVLEDPRGPATGDTEDFKVRYEFDTQGLPVKIAGPADQHGYIASRLQQWNVRGQITCVRSEAAEALSPVEDPQDCVGDGDPDGLATTYEYDDDFSPYRLERVTSGTSDLGSDDAAVVDLQHDAAAGPRYTVYDTIDASGPAVGGGYWNGDLDHNYSTSGPSGVSGNDTWSIVFEGTLDVPYGTSGEVVEREYKFQGYFDDGLDIVVGGKTLVSCFSSPYCASPSGQPAIKLKSGTHPVVIRFAEDSGSASFDVLWKPYGSGTYTTMAGTDIPAGEAVEDEVTYPVADDGTTNGTRLRATMELGSQAAQQLPEEIIEEDLGSELEVVVATDYDTFGRLLSRTEAEGGPEESTTDYTYAAATRCEESIEGPVLDMLTEQTCNSRGQVLTETVHVQAAFDQVAQERVTTTTYDDLGRTLSVAGPNGALTTYTYDAAGRVLTEQVATDAGNATTTNSYDDAGNLVLGDRPNGAEVYFSYDDVGNMLTATDPREDEWVTTFTYDAKNREISRTSPSNLVSLTSYTLYDEVGEVYENTVIETAPSGAETTYIHDLRGQEIAYKSPGASPEEFAYDPSGNEVAYANSAGVTTTTTYDAWGNEASSSTPLVSDQAMTTTSTDALGREVMVEGPRPSVDDDVEYTYDDAGNLLTATQVGIAAPNVTRFDYSEAGELLRIRQPMHLDGEEVVYFTRTFSYDEAGNQVSRTDEQGTQQSTFGPTGELLELTRANGIAVTYEYDVAGNEIHRSMLGNTWAPDGLTPCTECNVLFDYDLAGNQIHAARSDREIDVTYDLDGRVEQIEDWDGVQTRTYDEVTGQLESLSSAAGVTEFSYDADGRLEAVTDPFTEQATTFTYDEAGRMDGRTDPAGLVWERDFVEETGLVNSQTITNDSEDVLAHFDLGYDAAGNVTSRVEEVSAPGSGLTDGSGEWAYTYDGANRMETSTDPDDVTTTYAYDGMGNRTSVQVGSGDPAITTYNDSGLPASDSEGTVYHHDEEGNLTSVDADGSSDDRCYFYDGFNLLRSAKVGALTGCSRTVGDILYSYDALGRTSHRSSSIGGSSATTFAYEGLGEDLAEITRTGSGAATTAYANSPSRPLVQEGPGGVGFFLRDLHGDAVGTADTDGEVAGSTLYSPWGEPIGTTGDSSALGFQSQYTDADTGYVDMTTRMYAPTMGRFTSRDVLFGDLSAVGSLNQFGYAEGNPVTMWDPSGMHAKCSDMDYESVTESKRKACVDVTGVNTTKKVHENVWGYHVGSESDVDRFQLRVRATWNWGSGWTYMNGSAGRESWPNGGDVGAQRHLHKDKTSVGSQPDAYRVQGMVCIWMPTKKCGNWISSPNHKP